MTSNNMAYLLIRLGLYPIFEKMAIPLKKNLHLGRTSAIILFAVNSSPALIKEVQIWQNVISAERVLPSASRCPIPTDVPTGPGNPTSSVSRRSSTARPSVCTPAPVACVPAKLLVQYPVPQQFNVWLTHKSETRTKEKPYGFFFYYYSEIKTSNAKHWMFFSYLNFFFISK